MDDIWVFLNVSYRSQRYRGSEEKGILNDILIR